ncbi:MAG: hypothetical protein HUJ30_01860, partial [Gammaproteobacteria bacterium]|nr:hypothetical protein [Gammaproteobacteria bacterium]
MKRLVAVLSLLGLLASPLASAVPVTVDPGQYTGLWRTSALAGYRNGIQTIDLPLGTHLFYVAAGTTRSSFNITVTDSGLISSDNLAAAQGGQNVLNLNTLTVDIDPQAYQGRWSIYAGRVRNNGFQSIVLVPGLAYRLRVADYISEGDFEFFLDASGEVVSGNPTAAVGGAASLRLNNSTITINPNRYSGSWGVYAATSSHRGRQDVVLVPSLGYVLRIVDFTNRADFIFTVDADGIVRSRNSGAASGGKNRLDLNNINVVINPNDYLGQWKINSATSWLSGLQDVVLIPSLTYTMRVGGYSQRSEFYFHVAANGMVSSHNSAAANGDNQRLNFNNTTVTIDPQQYPGLWRLYAASGDLYGSHVITLVPALSYHLRIAGTRVITC